MISEAEGCVEFEASIPVGEGIGANRGVPGEDFCIARHRKESQEGPLHGRPGGKGGVLAITVDAPAIIVEADSGKGVQREILEEKPGMLQLQARAPMV